MMNALSTIEVTKTGLIGVEKLTETEFFDQGRKLARMEKGLQWAIGDWYNNIPWGDKKAACEEAGLKYKTAIEASRACSTFKMSERSDILPFDHHYRLIHSDLAHPDRIRLLKRAIEGGWSSAKMKTERDIIMGKAPPPPTKGFDDGVKGLEEAIDEKLPESVNKATRTKIKKGIESLASDLKHEFSDAVEKSAEAKSKTQRDNMKQSQDRADKRFEDVTKMKAGVKAFLTKAEFILIRSCLHPDKNPHPKAERAFTAFNKLADVKNW